MIKVNGGEAEESSYLFPAKLLENLQEDNATDKVTTCMKDRTDKHDKEETDTTDLLQIMNLQEDSATDKVTNFMKDRPPPRRPT